MRWLQRLFHRTQLERQLDAELRFHLEQQEAELVALGRSPKEARREARLAFGGQEQIKEECRDARGIRWVEELVHDLRYAVRMLRKSPAFTLVAIGSLALGVGANTAVFSFVNALLLQSLPVAEADRLVTFRQDPGMFGMNTAFGYPFYRQTAQRSSAFSGVLTRYPVTVNLSANGETSRVRAELVSGSYFSVLGIRPFLGRLLNADDDGAESTHPVCVISHSLWQQRFGSDPAVVGRSIQLNATRVAIAGVTEPGFYGPELQGRIDLQLPAAEAITFAGVKRDAEGWAWLQIMARLAPGRTLAQAQSEFNALGQALDQEAHRKTKTRYSLDPAPQGFGSLAQEYSRPILVLMGAVGLVLSIACANLASLLLARAAVRQREMALRLSLGARRGRLVRQLLTESLLLSVLGGFAGLAISIWLADALAAMLTAGRSTLALSVAPDARVLAFAAALSLLTGVLFGLLPALQSTRAALLPALKSGRQNGSRSGWMRDGLVVAQIALSLVLLVGAGLLSRSLGNLRSVDLGFAADHIVLMSMNPAQSGFRRADEQAVLGALLERVRAVPGVASASLASISVLTGSMFAADVQMPGYLHLPQEPNAYFNSVSPDYFRTMSTPQLAGRDFTARDADGAPGVVIVNEEFVRHFGLGANPIGRQFSWAGKGKVQIVGVVKNAKYFSVRERPPITAYLPLAQVPAEEITLQVRTSGDANRVLALLREQVRAVAPKLPVYQVTTLSAQRDATITSERLLAFLSTLLGGIAAALSAIGLYGVLAYTAARRRKEIGIRIAVGASRRDVVRLFFAETSAILGMGLAIGLPLALLGARALESLLFGLTPGDAPTLLGMVALLLLTGVVAAWIPARRAVRVDPASVLRYE